MVLSPFYDINNSIFSIIVFHNFVSANSHENVSECLRRLLDNSEVNSIISEAITEGGEEVVVTCYLHDFTHMVYKPRLESEVEVMVELDCILIIRIIKYLFYSLSVNNFSKHRKQSKEQKH